jgi:hypothetical protein
MRKKGFLKRGKVRKIKRDRLWERDSTEKVQK